MSLTAFSVATSTAPHCGAFFLPFSKRVGWRKVALKLDGWHLLFNDSDRERQICSAESVGARPLKPV